LSHFIRGNETGVVAPVSLEFASTLWRIWLPSAFVIFSLASLLLIPLLLERRIQRLRDELAEVIEPARISLGQLQLSYARQAVALRNYLLSGDPRFLAMFERLRADETRRAARLELLARELGNNYALRARTLLALAEQWHAEQQDLLRGRTSPAVFLDREPDDVSQERLLAPALQLDEHLVRVGRTRRAQIRQVEALGFLLIAALTALAAISAILVANSAQQFRRRAVEEHALREAASTLTEAVEVGEVLRRIAHAAVAVERGSSAYVERIVGDDEAVEVVGSAGPLAPRLDTRAASPGSLPAADITAATPEIVTDVRDEARPMMAHVARKGAHCAVVIPLVADGIAYGALVLVRGPDRRPFRSSALGPMRTFAALAALALRKSVLLEQARARQRALQQAAESRARLLRGFSHDVKNPLAAADGHAAILAEGIVADREGQLESARRIRGSIRSALDLIDDLVELGRAEAGQLQIRSAPVHIGTLVASTDADFRAAAAAAGLTLETQIAPELPAIETDAARVRQVLGNLLSNAIKYTPRGGRIVLTVSSRDGRRGRDSSRWVTIAVTDSGPGIPPDQRRRLFQEFTRLDPDATPGAGLGLAISQRIAWLLGAEISLASEVGVGSTFTLWLPRAA
jgi:signal transduction histidine kinase